MGLSSLLCLHSCSQCTGLSKVRRTKCWKLLTLEIPATQLRRCGPNRQKTVGMDCWKGAGNKMMLQSLMWNHSLQRIQTPQVSENSSYRKLQYPGIALKWALSVMRKSSPEQLFKCGFGLGFWFGFYAFDHLFSFEVFRRSFLPIPCFLVCLLVKAATGEEGEK